MIISRPREAGFTLVELVVVMLLLTVLASFGASRFGASDVFAAQSLADRLASGLRSAQASAIAQRQTIYISITASPPTLSVCRDAGCSDAVSAVSADGDWLASAQGLSLDSSASFQFLPNGSSSLSSTLTLQINGSGAVSAPTLRVESSGLVQRP